MKQSLQMKKYNLFGYYMLVLYSSLMYVFRDKSKKYRQALHILLLVNYIQRNI